MAQKAGLLVIKSNTDKVLSKPIYLFSKNFFTDTFHELFNLKELTYSILNYNKIETKIKQQYNNFNGGVGHTRIGKTQKNKIIIAINNYEYYHNNTLLKRIPLIVALHSKVKRKKLKKKNLKVLISFSKKKYDISISRDPFGSLVKKKPKNEFNNEIKIYQRLILLEKSLNKLYGNNIYIFINTINFKSLFTKLYKTSWCPYFIRSGRFLDQYFIMSLFTRDLKFLGYFISQIIRRNYRNIMPVIKYFKKTIIGACSLYPEVSSSLLGFRLEYKGKFRKAARKRKYGFHFGQISTQHFENYADYYFENIISKFGTASIKIFIFYK